MLLRILNDAVSISPYLQRLMSKMHCDQFLALQIHVVLHLKRADIPSYAMATSVRQV